MVDEVDRLVDLVRLDDVHVDVAEVLRIANVLDVRKRAGLEVVDADHTVSAGEQLVAKMRTEEASTACDHARWHCTPV